MVPGRSGIALLSGGLEGAYGEGSPIVLLLNTVNLIISLIILFCPGTKGYNKFGADPLMRDIDYADSVFGDGSSPDREPARPYDPNHGSYIRKPPAREQSDTKRFDWEKKR